MWNTAFYWKCYRALMADFKRFSLLECIKLCTRERLLEITEHRQWCIWSILTDAMPQILLLLHIQFWLFSFTITNLQKWYLIVWLSLHFFISYMVPLKFEIYLFCYEKCEQVHSIRVQEAKYLSLAPKWEFQVH